MNQPTDRMNFLMMNSPGRINYPMINYQGGQVNYPINPLHNPDQGTNFQINNLSQQAAQLSYLSNTGSYLPVTTNLNSIETTIPSQDSNVSSPNVSGVESLSHLKPEDTEKEIGKVVTEDIQNHKEDKITSTSIEDTSSQDNVQKAIENQGQDEDGDEQNEDKNEEDSDDDEDDVFKRKTFSGREGVRLQAKREHYVKNRTLTDLVRVCYCLEEDISEQISVVVLIQEKNRTKIRYRYGGVGELIAQLEERRPFTLPKDDVLKGRITKFEAFNRFHPIKEKEEQKKPFTRTTRNSK